MKRKTLKSFFKSDKQEEQSRKRKLIIQENQYLKTQNRILRSQLEKYIQKDDSLVCHSQLESSQSQESEDKEKENKVNQDDVHSSDESESQTYSFRRLHSPLSYIHLENNSLESEDIHQIDTDSHIDEYVNEKRLPLVHVHGLENRGEWSFLLSQSQQSLPSSQDTS